jgi:trk system potassium uptake protein TrkH
LFWLLGRNISLSDRLMLREIVPGSTLAQVVRTAITIVGSSVAIQAVGAVVLFVSWLSRYPVGDAAYLALFHTVSAFCNAGFDVFGALGQADSSLTHERHNPFIMLPTVALVVIGGLGFPVISELAAWRPIHRARSRTWTPDHVPTPRPPLSLNTRLVVVAHLGLVALGFVMIWLLEFRNPATLGGDPMGGQILETLNAATAPRSSGFATEVFSALRPTTILVIMVLMFIGTGSAGTGGGVKVNTVAALFASVAGTLAGRSRPELFKRTLAQESINKSLAVVVISALVIILATFILSLTEPDIALERLLFEAISAFSTVGLSLGVTPDLSEIGRVLVVLMMFAGRLGPLTLVLLLTARERTPLVTYAEEPVLVG